MPGRICFLIVCFSCLSYAKAETPFEALFERALQKNPDYAALLNEKEATDSQLSGAYSVYYPTLSAVGGWEDRREDIEPARGYVGFLRGQLNLFNGFRDQSDIRQAGSAVLASEASLEIRKRELRLSLSEAVSEMLYLHGLQEILAQELKVSETQKQMASRKVTAGLTSSVDNIEFELRQDELEIQKRRIDQLHTENHQKLFKIFGEDLSDKDLEKVQMRNLLDIKSVLKNAQIRRNPVISKIEAELDQSQASTVAARSSLIPKLDIEFASGRITPSENSSLRFNESRVGVFLTVPLFSFFGSYYKVRTASLQVAAKEKEKLQATINVQTDLEVLKEKMRETIELSLINERKRSRSRKYFDMTLSEYRRGIKNSPDLVGATTRLFDSEKQKFELQRDLEILATKLENLM